MRQVDPPLTQKQRVRFALTLASLTALMLLAATCGACATAAVPPPAPAGMTPREQHMSIVAIRTTCPNTPTQYGSGSIVGAHHALTAAHVARCKLFPRNAGVPDAANPTIDAVLVEVDPGDGTWHPGVVDDLMPDADLARVSFDGIEDRWHPKRVVIGPYPGIGERVCVAAAIPAGSYRCGIAQPRLTDPTGPGDLVWDGVVEPGNSGSPVYDSLGRLVGVVTHTRLCSNESQFCYGRATSLASRADIMPAE